MFKKLIITLGAFGLLTSLNSAYSDDTATLYLAGEVELISNLVVTPTADATSLLDIVNGENNRPIAQIEETSNNANGYTIFLESANSGQLRNPATGSTPVDYDIQYGSETPAQPGAPGSPVNIKTVSALTGLTTTTEPVTITFSGSSSAVAGAYTDTLVFVMDAL